ncbi:hypothetical protein BGZ58_001397 [Dissophora ornata]|nr:hypothetical protein BGZ58_001397 [Dissophora ornata]
MPILQKNAHFVRSLTLKASDGLAPFLQRCTGLKTFVLFGKHIETPNPELWAQFTDLIWQNPLMEWIVLGFGFDRTTAPSIAFLKALPLACPNLKRYESSRGKYDHPEQVEALMQAVSRIKTVSSRYEYFVNIPSFKRWTFPHLFEMALKDATGLSPGSQVDLVCQCPNLKLLKWTVGRETLFPVQDFCERVPAACPKLRQLHIDGCGLPDPEDIGRMLDTLSHMEQLVLCGSRITKRTFGCLGRHFETLQTVDIIDCFDVKSWMVQQILESCPNLTKLASPVLRMHDIVTGKDWAAVQLRHFQVNVERSHSMPESIEEHWATFRQLSRLRWLQHLTVGSLKWTRRSGLLFRIDYGMDQLKSLTKLKILDLGGSCQRMDEGEVVWIGAHLDNLTKIEGIFSLDWERHLDLTMRLCELGLDVPEKDMPETFYGESMSGDEEEDGYGEEGEEEEEDDEYYDVYEEEDGQAEGGEETTTNAGTVESGSVDTAHE